MTAPLVAPLIISAIVAQIFLLSRLIVSAAVEGDYDTGRRIFRPITSDEIEDYDRADSDEKPDLQYENYDGAEILQPPAMRRPPPQAAEIPNAAPSRHVVDHFMRSVNDIDIDRHCPRHNHHNLTSEQLLVAPFNETCLETFFKKMSAHLRRYYAWEELLYTTLYFIISILAVIGNGVVILAVIRKKEMRTNRNVFIVNLALSNLVLALTTIPFLWWPSIDFEFPYSKFFCKFANALPGSNIYCSTLTISVMAVDRYYSVKRMNVVQSERAQRFRSVLISLIIWMLSFLLSLPLLLYYDTTMLYVFKDVLVNDTSPGAEAGSTTLRSYGWRQCRLSPGGTNDAALASLDAEDTADAALDARTIQLLMSLLQVLFLYVIPLVVLLIFNMKLTRFLRFNAQQISRSRRDTIHRESLAPSPAKYHKSTKSNGIGLPPPFINNTSRSSDKHLANGRGDSQRWSVSSLPKMSLTDTGSVVPIFNGHGHSEDSGTSERLHSTLLQASCPSASQSERAAERRRNRTTALLVTMACSYAVLWFPFTLVSMLIDLEILHSENERVDQACKLISITSICVNPFLYGFLNTNFRHEFTDIFGSWMKCVTKLERLICWLRDRVGGINGAGHVGDDDAYTSTRRRHEPGQLLASLRQSLYLSSLQAKTSRVSTTLITTVDEMTATQTDRTPRNSLQSQLKGNNADNNNNTDNNNSCNCRA